MLQDWIGKTETRHDTVTLWPMAALAAVLDRSDPPPRPGDPLPPLWHWLYFLPTDRQCDLGADGHPRRGGFLPPVELPRRMWAGGRLTFHQSLHAGQEIVRTSRVARIEEKQGRTGPLVFVLVRHEISGPAGLAITEEHDIVYRGHGGPAPAPPAAPGGAAWEQTIRPDDVLLFRYSALTFNGHRIHYDRRYAVETEGYPGLVVHGPLIATLLIELLRRNRPHAQVTRFQFRAVSPLFDLEPFRVCGRPCEGGAELWAANDSGGLAMTASAALREP